MEAPGDYLKVKEAMIEAGHEPVDSELTMRAANNVELGVEDSEKVQRLIDTLEELDDVQEVYHNADLHPDMEQ